MPLSSGPEPGPLAPFRYRAFRFQWPADLLTSWALEMEVLILAWYILVETQSVLLLTMFGALQYFGTLISPMFGVAADRIGHRTVLVLMRATYTVLATTLMATALAGLLEPKIVLIIAFLSGLVRPSDIGMRASLTGQAVPAAHLVAAMGISRTTADSARIMGAIAGAGLFTALGIGKAYIAISLFYLAGCLFTLGASAPRLVKPAANNPDGSAARQPSPWRDLCEGLKYVWHTPRLLAMMWLAFLVNLTAFPLSNGLLPYVAKSIYGVDQNGLGYLVASFAGGALIGSITLSLLRAGVRLERLMLVCAGIWYGLLFGFAQMQSAIPGAAMLFMAGLAQSLCMVSMAVMIVRTAEEKFRGRVMGVRMLAIYSLPLGLVAAGFLTQRIGFQATASIYAVVGLVATVAIGIHWRSVLWRSA